MAEWFRVSQFQAASLWFPHPTPRLLSRSAFISLLCNSPTIRPALPFGPAASSGAAGPELWLLPSDQTAKLISRTLFFVLKKKTKNKNQNPKPPKHQTTNRRGTAPPQPVGQTPALDGWPREEVRAPEGDTHTPPAVIYAVSRRVGWRRAVRGVGVGGGGAQARADPPGLAGRRDPRSACRGRKLTPTSSPKGSDAETKG